MAPPESTEVVTVLFFLSAQISNSGQYFFGIVIEKGSSTKVASTIPIFALSESKKQIVCLSLNPINLHSPFYQF